MPKLALARIETDLRDEGVPLVDLSCDSLFAATLEATVITDVPRGTIINANLAAAQLLGVARKALVGMPLSNMMEGASQTAMRAALRNIRASGAARLDAFRVRGCEAEFSLQMSYVNAGNAGYVLARFSAARSTNVVDSQVCSLVYDAVDDGSTGLVVTDAGLTLIYANRAFLRLIAVDLLSEALGRPLARWIELSADDLHRMGEQMVTREAAIPVSLRLKNARQSQTRLQALAIAVPHEESPLWGFSVRERMHVNRYCRRRLPPATPAPMHPTPTQRARCH